MTLGASTEFVNGVINWLRHGVGFDDWAKRHGDELASVLGDHVWGRNRDSEGWGLGYVDGLSPEAARAEIVHWLWRNEHAGIYCSPSFTRTFSAAVGFALFADGMVPISHGSFHPPDRAAEVFRFEETQRSIAETRKEKPMNLDTPRGMPTANPLDPVKVRRTALRIDTFDDGSARLLLDGYTTDPIKSPTGALIETGWQVEVERTTSIDTLEKIGRIILHHVEQARANMAKQRTPQMLGSEIIDL